VDIYFNRNNLEEPSEEPNEENYINSVVLEHHKLISNFVNEFNKIGIAFPFFEDFFLSYDEVISIKNILLNNQELIHNSDEGKKAYTLLLNILELAENEKTGLISFSD